MDVEETLIRLEQEMLAFKTHQNTNAESAKFYTYTTGTYNGTRRIIFETNTGKDALTILSYGGPFGYKILPEPGYFNQWRTDYSQELFLVSTQPGFIREEHLS